MSEERKESTRQRGDEHWTRRMPERVRRGPEAQGAKLTRKQIEEMCAEWATQEPKPMKTRLGRKYGVSRFTVWRVLRLRGLL